MFTFKPIDSKMSEYIKKTIQNSFICNPPTRMDIIGIYNGYVLSSQSIPTNYVVLLLTFVAGFQLGTIFRLKN